MIKSWDSYKLTVEKPCGLPYTLFRLALRCAVQWEIVGIKKGDNYVALFGSWYGAYAIALVHILQFLCTIMVQFACGWSDRYHLYYEQTVIFEFSEIA